MPSRDDTATLLSALADDIAVIVGEASKRWTAEADALHRKLGVGDLAAARPVTFVAEDIDVVIQRVRKVLNEGDASSLRPSDCRAAAYNFRRLSGDEVRILLQYQPSCWPRFVNRLFAERLEVGAREWRTWAALAEDAPRSVAVLHGPFNRSDLLNEEHADSAASLARRWSGLGSLRELDSKICAPGLLNRAWPYTSLIFARWAELHADRWTEIWDEVTSEVLFEAMLLPRKEERSWFSSNGSTAFPIAIPENIETQVRFTSACLESHLSGTVPDEVRAEMLIRILAAAWKDPRSLWGARDNPRYAGWKQFAEMAPTTYGRLIERLLAADLDLFFENVEIDRDRRRYWRRHLKSMKATSFFFCRTTVDELKTRFRPKHPMHEKVASALLRARELQGSGALDALVLVFRLGVVVEFSKIGNAAYLYTHQEYASLTKNIRRNATASSLKDPVRGLKMIHKGGWQADFDVHLASIL